VSISAYRVHQAMQDAPHDGKDFRQARAAVANVLAQIAALNSEQLAELGLQRISGTPPATTGPEKGPTS